MTRARRIAAAARRFESFTGHRAESVDRVPMPRLPREALAVGPVIAIEYETVRDGSIERYRHKFSKRSRPLLIASFDGRHIMLYGGAYRFTDRGIVDRKK